MPPKKEKTEKLSAEAGTTLVFEYLKQQNRPYSSIEISANLHNKVTKTQAAKILKDLADSNQIASKASGKQLVYHAIQNLEDGLNPQESADLNQQIDALRDRTSVLKDEEKALKMELAKLKAKLTLPELREQYQNLVAEESQLETRLHNLKSGAIQAVSTVKKTEVEKHLKLLTYKAHGRKKACMDLWNALSENLPEEKTKHELWEELGLETPTTV